MRRTLGWGVAAAAMLVAAATPAGAAEHRPARVTGSAEFALPYGQDDDVQSFTFDARSAPYSRPLPIPRGGHGSPADAAGTVRVSHWLSATDITVRWEASVDCMITSPGHATLTGIVTRADQGASDFVGKRVGFSVQDGGRHGDRVGFTWSASFDQDEAGQWGPARIGTCLAPAAFATVTRGNFTVRHAELTAPPESE
ncbi:hypothetical protein IW249_005961 [Micromonospora vinacea]|uniref:Repetin n=1 Tax=Micromonospora vinacea TaxID=709878 RepID=A0ABS0KA71_9ACTN|nr:hypothetical protein [Micromonospora vinacea]MBG6105547.1 hypothetical protein [Micromonospora vinacea]